MQLDVRALGARIGQLRELKGLSLGALAEAAGGMAKSYLAKVERGEVENPGLKTLSAIARALDVTVADLLAPVASSPRGPAGEALLAEDAKYAQITSNLPPGLGEYLQMMKQNGQPVPPEIVKALALVQFRGKRPEKPEDWRFLHDAMMRSLS
jgi:transcriptional regulator with XRE-family HTH domain